MGYKIFEYDPLLLPYKRHIELRMEKYEKKRDITEERVDELEILDQDRDEKKSGFARLLSAFGIGN